jgi:aquaporin Z
MPKTKATSKAKTPAKKAVSSPAGTTVTSTVGSTKKETIKDRLGRDLTSNAALGALLAEFLGTFGLVGVLLCTGGNAFMAGLTVIVFVLVLGRISGSHINPAVTIAMLTAKKISWLQACAYIFVQLLGAMVAFVVFAQLANNASPVPTAPYGELGPQTLASVKPLFGDWQPFFAEILGALIFGLGIAAATLTKREGFETAFMIGGALTLGLFAASFSSGAVLNPAVALGLDAYKFATGHDWWTLAIYAVGPVIGVTAGVWLYKFMQLGNKDAAKA